MAEDEKPKEQSHEAFRQQWLDDPTFGAKLKMFEESVKPENIKDRDLSENNYAQDSFDLATKETEEDAELDKEFDLRWKGMINLAQITYAWFKEWAQRKDALGKKRLGRALQDAAIHAIQSEKKSEALISSWKPGAIMATLTTQIEEEDKIFKKHVAQHEKTMGLLKLGKEKEKEK